MAEKNIITAIAEIKPGHVAPLRATLQAFADPVRTSPISVIGVIHFARWVLIDDDTRLLFTTNFDGSWDDYIDEFIDKAADGLDAIFGHCVGYPERGSRDAETFKQYIRDHEYKADLFYTAYPDATVKDIHRALRIREKFESLLDEFQ